jgi:hypothetical protein
MSTSERHLREHLKRLPDFNDIGEESRALDHVESHEDFLRALWFWRLGPRSTARRSSSSSAARETEAAKPCCSRPRRLI